MSNGIFRTEKDVKNHFKKVRQKIKDKEKEKELLKGLGFHQMLRILETRKF